MLTDELNSLAAVSFKKKVVTIFKKTILHIERECGTMKFTSKGQTSVTCYPYREKLFIHFFNKL